MTYKMYLDDLRIPKTSYCFPNHEVLDSWVIIRSSDEAIDYIHWRGLPDEISFDHDLGGEDTSIVFINYMIALCLDFPQLKFPKKFNVHSANPVGAENIKHLMNNFINFTYGSI